MILKLLLWILIISMANANSLINEESPYLRQHAHNPVNWYAWGDKAFKRAKDENRLIFLSIGYSTCHWCHVMERESFENRDIAKVLNQYFVSIKLDREEHPDIDRYYQDIYTLMNGRGGGWPLTIVMTPDKGVFFSATYMPPERLKSILLTLHDAYINKKSEVLNSVESIKNAFSSIKRSKRSKVADPSKKIVDSFVKNISLVYDFKYKGIGTAPKFPHATTIDTLLNIYRINGNKEALKMATDMLKAMANGGIYDQVEGGFYRYSTDKMWMIPHFEKMLYTNAELLEAYANGYFLTKNELFKDVAVNTIKNIKDRFFKDGLYMSASDADSDGEEGRYFLFDYDDILKDLIKNGYKKSEAVDILGYFGIFEMEGNFATNLTNPYITRANAPKDLKRVKEILFKNRSKKSYPFIDYKIQTSWNALFIKGLLKVSKYIDKRYLKDALRTLDKIKERLFINKELYHQVIGDNKPKIKGYLEDYAFLISALIDAYDQSLDRKYLNFAQELKEIAIRKFYKNGVWEMSDEGFSLDAKFDDSSYRSAAVVMVDDLIDLSMYEENIKLFNFAKESFSSSFEAIKKNPQYYPYAINVYAKILLSPIIIKSSRDNLISKKDKIDAIKYPYILRKVSEDKKFIVCKYDRCFGVEDDIDKLIEVIDKNTKF